MCEDRKRRRTELMQGRNAGKGKGNNGKADADRGKGKDDKDFVPPTPCPPWRYWPIALPDRDRAMGCRRSGRELPESSTQRIECQHLRPSTRRGRSAPQSVRV